MNICLICKRWTSGIRILSSFSSREIQFSSNWRILLILRDTTESQLVGRGIVLASVGRDLSSHDFVGICGSNWRFLVHSRRDLAFLEGLVLVVEIKVHHKGVTICNWLILI